MRAQWPTNVPVSQFANDSNPSLEPDRRSNADLIVIEAEEIVIAAVLAVQIVHPGAQPPGNQHVK